MYMLSWKIDQEPKLLFNTMWEMITPGNIMLTLNKDFFITDVGCVFSLAKMWVKFYIVTSWKTT